MWCAALSVPEFLNRLDEIILFNRLGRNELKRIVDIQLEHLQRLLDRPQDRLQIDEQAREWLASTGYDPVYGARPLKRVIQRNLQDRLAGLLLEGSIKDGEVVRVTASPDGLEVRPGLAEAA
jgi:ATP-dependent Clp protease ATP-binding subunit ClpB